MKKRRLFIIGAGGSGRGLEYYLGEVPSTQRDWELQGFIDENVNALDGKPSDYTILGDINTFEFEEGDLAVIAVGDPKVRESVYLRLKDRVQFLTYVDSRAIVGKFCEIGEGSLILANCIISNNVKIGKFAFIIEKAIVGHDTVLGDFCSLMPNVDIAGGCTLGNKVLVGTNATVIPMKSIVDEVVVGAGSVVVRNIKEKCTVFGNPAKAI